MGVMRKTKSVKTLLTIFEQANTAISVTELVERLCQEMNKTTVYRILERLEHESIIHSFIEENGRKWYAKCKSTSQHLNPHPHFQCRVCGKTICLYIDVAIPKVPNYKIHSAELLLIGQCADCCTKSQ